ncbi:uncharacterized protein LOC121000718 isoform X2 [Bufo bufo]|uniref:uncharacterized protein LOC121000718 isoform X2 n=1 Tax=Bufo bufo TaxID=8384 RepID=UPI001ABEBFFB|nr:uncharacterized protein LOC121000718 isoform X2 [Bufo bufo]
MQMLCQKNPYLSSIRGVEDFIMDPNLLRFPEVVLTRIEVKIEDDPPTSAGGKEDQSLVKPRVKSEKIWKESNAAAPFYSSARTEDAGYHEAERSKDYNGETAPATSGDAGYSELGREPLRSGCNGLSKQIRRNPGRRKRGGWHQYVCRERQQFDRKKKKHCAAYVEEERQRGQRFSEEENQVLVEGVLSHYKDLCGHSSLKGSATRKRRLWQEVVNNVNSVATTYRTIEVCKKRYGDCKRSVKVKMAALERKAMGWGVPQEQIKFSNWEESLRQKITSIPINGVRRVLDTCEPSSLEPSAAQITQSPMCEPVSDYDNVSSLPDIHLVSEYSEEEEAPSTPADPVPYETVNAAEPQPEHMFPTPSDPTSMMNGPETSVTGQHQLQEDLNTSLQHLTQVQNVELHKLRENVVEGNARVVQQLEGLVSEVRELNAHVQQIHLNQAHFNHMFQNYISDTKQFYGSIVQAIKALQPAPTVSPMASPTSSPLSSTKYSAAHTNPMLMTAAMFDSTSLSPAGSAEPPSVSSTASEVNPTSHNQGGRPPLAFQFQPLRKY